MRNVVIWGRATTNVLQQLRRATGFFDEWYDAWRREMESDPLLKYLYKLRNRMLKAGELAVTSHTYISRLTSRDIPPRSTWPPGADDFFIGDQLGGSGWTVRLPDGSLTKVYVRLPEEVGRSWLELAGVPDSHLGTPINDRSVKAICDLYVVYLRRFVEDAEQTFSPPAP